MKTQMQSDYTMPKKGFFSNHCFNHTLANPLHDPRPQPKRYDPRQNHHENIAWVKPDHDPYESTYHATFNKSKPSDKIQKRVQDPEVFPQRNLSNTLIPKTWPVESKRRPVSHHETGIDARDFREVANPSHKQYPNTKYADHMINTTLAFSPATEKYLSPAQDRSRSPMRVKKSPAEVLRTIYVDKSDLAEHIRENHEDAHMQSHNIANRQFLKEEFDQYNKAFNGRAGNSSIKQRLNTVEPRKKQERRDVSSHTLRPLLDHQFQYEKDYSAVDRDFKYAYVAPCHTRHPVTGKNYGIAGSGIVRERPYDRIVHENRPQSPEGPFNNARNKSESRVKDIKDVATPINVSRLIRKHRHQ